MRIIYERKFSYISYFILLPTLIFTSCKKDDSVSRPDYIKLGVSGLTSVAMKPSISLCTNDSSKIQEIKKAAEMWLASLNQKPQVQVLENNSGGNCDATINYIQMGGSPSYTQVQNSSAEISMNSGSQWFVSFGVLVHEFGHAFGLSDTYNTQSGKAGDCVAGQPRQSIMCDPGLGSPQEDDIQGVRAVSGGNIGGPIPDFSGSTNNLNNNISNNGNSNNISLPNNGSINTNPPVNNGTLGADSSMFSALFQSLGLSQADIFQIESIATDFLSQSGSSLANVGGFGLTETKLEAKNIYSEKVCPANMFKVIYSTNRSKQYINIISKIDSNDLTFCAGAQCLRPHAGRLIPSKSKISAGYMYTLNLAPEENTSDSTLESSSVTLFGKINESSRHFRCSVQVESLSSKN